jgi:hypothetical protein
MIYVTENEEFAEAKAYQEPVSFGILICLVKIGHEDWICIKI